ncbi:MAG: MOSC domain-containing protein [Actinomycetota bacterium]|nr:MOSC domain-containing protein [Actinomycetota bacterium]
MGEPSGPLGRVVTVNVGLPREVTAERRTVTTAIWKAPVSGRVRAIGTNLEGDEQADHRYHGGPDKAVYAYALEDNQWWAAELGRSLEPGTMGENLTLAGVDVTNAVVGERWAVGSAIFEVCQPRTPCAKLGLRMGDPRFPKRFAAAGRPGAYVRIHAEGDVGAGDEVRVVHRPAHGLTVAEVAGARSRDPVGLPRMLVAPELADDRVRWALERGLKELRRNPSDHLLRARLTARLTERGLAPEEVEAALEPPQQ